MRNIGAVFGQRTGLWWDLPVIESLDLLRHIYRVPAIATGSNLRLFDELLELGAFLDTPVRSLSLGQRMRADLAAALLHDPTLLFLDEPTIGLDVVAKERIRSSSARSTASEGTTVILTTHDLGDVEKLCERVIMIDHGRLMFDGALEALRQRFGEGRVLVVDFEALPAAAVPPRRRAGPHRGEPRLAAGGAHRRGMEQAAWRSCRAPVPRPPRPRSLRAGTGDRRGRAAHLRRAPADEAG